ncbi:sortase [uncultured Flavonifractor sp.]|uniref:sortase n=1 Tax=uncultured Flavonifractor sp. TaxID=1193534 RepID=UPI002599409E|nr:sortase [uncultured Flavonifractor sp.]
MYKNKIASLLLAAAIAGGSAVPVFAAEYDFGAADTGQRFHEASSVGTGAAADSDTIVVGSDGTIGTDESNLPSSNVPMSVQQLPVGDFPNGWGIATDVAIAQNTVFPNALGPTTQWSGISGVVGPDTYGIDSGALPTGYQQMIESLPKLAPVPPLYALPNAQPVYTGGTYGYYAYGSYLYDPLGGAYYAYSSAATALTPMPKLNDGTSAIAKVSIPSVGMEQYVYEGTGSSPLAKGVGHFDCTPGWNGNVGLAGHNRNNSNTAAFQRLKDVDYGDLVYYTTVYGTRVYQVTSIEAVSVNDTSGLAQDGSYKLTMYTCKANQPDVKLKVTATLVGV